MTRTLRNDTDKIRLTTLFTYAPIPPAAKATGPLGAHRVATDKISVTVDQNVLAAAGAKAAGMKRSETIERALRNEHLCIALDDYTTRNAPALNIDSYTPEVYHPNRGPTCDRVGQDRAAISFLDAGAA